MEYMYVRLETETFLLQQNSGYLIKSHIGTMFLTNQLVLTYIVYSKHLI